MRPAAPPAAGQPVTPAPGVAPGEPPAPGVTPAPEPPSADATGTEPIAETLAEPPAAAESTPPPPSRRPRPPLASRPPRPRGVRPGPAGERLAPLDPRELNAASKRSGARPADIANATAGDRLLFDLPLPDRGRRGGGVLRGPYDRPQRRRSEFSNMVSIAPTDAAGTAGADHRHPPGRGCAGRVGRPGELARDGLQRLPARRPGARPTAPPVHSAGAAENSFLDSSARFGESYIYAVTALARPRAAGRERHRRASTRCATSRPLPAAAADRPGGAAETAAACAWSGAQVKAMPPATSSTAGGRGGVRAADRPRPSRRSSTATGESPPARSSLSRHRGRRDWQRERTRQQVRARAMTPFWYDLLF